MHDSIRQSTDGLRRASRAHCTVKYQKRKSARPSYTWQNVFAVTYLSPQHAGTHAAKWVNGCSIKDIKLMQPASPAQPSLWQRLLARITPMNIGHARGQS
jgi:hypothetical protein